MKALTFDEIKSLSIYDDPMMQKNIESERALYAEKPQWTAIDILKNEKIRDTNRIFIAFQKEFHDPKALHSFGVFYVERAISIVKPKKDYTIYLNLKKHWLNGKLDDEVLLDERQTLLDKVGMLSLAVYQVMSPNLDDSEISDAIRHAIGDIAQNAVFSSEMAKAESSVRKGQNERPIYDNVFKVAFDAEFKVMVEAFMEWMKMK